MGDWELYGLVVIMLLFVVGCVIVMCIINVFGCCVMVVYSFFWFGLVLLVLGVCLNGLEWVIFMLFGLYVVFVGGM